MVQEVSNEVKVPWRGKQKSTSLRTKEVNRMLCLAFCPNNCSPSHPGHVAPPEVWHGPVICHQKNERIVNWCFIICNNGDYNKHILSKYIYTISRSIGVLIYLYITMPHALNTVILTTSLLVRYYCPHFIQEEAKVWEVK